MSVALADFLKTVGALREIAADLGPAQIGSGMDRAANSLRLNGAHVTAFSALEDFIRRRVIEIIQWLGNNHIKFNDFPQVLKKYLLEETIRGINFSLQRTDDSERVSLLQLEGLLIETTINPAVKYEPSIYCFGKSQSNLSKSQLSDLINAMVIKDGFGSLTSVAAAAGLTFLGPPDRIFSRLATNRHRAAHGFGSDYRLQDFLDDLNSSLPLMAFAFDTCISQCANNMRKCVDEGRSINLFDATNIILRRFEFNATTSYWQEFRGSNLIQDLPKGGRDKRIRKFKKDNLAVGESILVRATNGGIEYWIQPI